MCWLDNQEGRRESINSLVVVQNRSSDDSLELPTVLQRLNGLHVDTVGTLREGARERESLIIPIGQLLIDRCTHRWHFQHRQTIKDGVLVLQQRQIRLEDVVELVGHRLVIGAAGHALFVYGLQVLVVQPHHTGQQLGSVGEGRICDVSVGAHDQNEPPERSQDELAALQHNHSRLAEVQVQELGHPHQLAAEGEAVHVRDPGGMKVGDSGDWVVLLRGASLPVVDEHDVHFPGGERRGKRLVEGEGMGAACSGVALTYWLPSWGCLRVQPNGFRVKNGPFDSPSRFPPEPLCYWNSRRFLCMCIHCMHMSHLSVNNQLSGQVR